MKNKIVFSIVDKKGIKQFHLHRIAKKIIAYSLLGIIGLIVSGFFLMSYLMEQVREINSIKTSMIDKYREIYMQNQKIREQIDAKSLELIDANKRVEDLEEIIDFSKNRDIVGDELNATSLKLEDQLFLLQIIPSGNPLEHFQKITSIKERIHPLKNKYGVNSGIDYIVPSNTPVYATADGIIELARKNTSLGGYGRFVKITHAYGFTSMYGHLSKTLVQKGDFVKKGQLIGYSGRSGASAGERLYYEVRFLGAYQDALAFAQWDSKDFESIFKKTGSINWNGLFWAIEDLKQLQSYQDR